MYPGGSNYPNGPQIGFNLDSNNSGYGGGGYGGAPYPSGSQGGFPSADYGYGNSSQGGYPGAGGYPGSSSGYPGSTPSYPGQSSYPSSSGGYPGGGSDYPSSGYPPQPSGGFGSSGYPPQPSGGYGSSGYPPQPSGGFGGPSGYPPQPSGGYGSSSGYPSQPSGGYGSSGYPSTTGGYGSDFPPTTKPPPAPYQPPPSVGGSNSLFPNLPGTSSGSGYGQPTSPPYGGGGSGYAGGSGYGGASGYGAGSGHGANYGQSFMGEPTLRPHQPFNPNDDATKLYKAMKGFGTDETTLIDILCKRTYSQRNEIALCFKTQYGKDLAKNLMDETSGNFKVLLKSLMMTPMQLQANDVKKAVDGVGTDEADLIEILCSKSNSEMIDLKNTYRQMFNRDMERDVGGDLSGYLKRLMVSLCAAHRSEAPPDHQKAAQLAKELYEGGMKRLGTDEVTFNRIFASESFAQLKLTFEEYYRLTGHDIEKAIKSEMSGYVEKAFLAIVTVVRNPSLFYADRLYMSMKGLGTHDHDLIRIMVLRSEIDLMTIKGEFQRKYSKTLESFIKGDCSGDYKRALLCLAGDPNWR